MSVFSFHQAYPFQVYKNGFLRKGFLWNHWGSDDVVVSCPHCETHTTLNGTYKIDPEGNVTPPFVCLYNDCSWYGWIRLENYKQEKL